MSRMQRILIADEPQSDGRYAAALGGAELVFARTMAEARAALASRCSLVLIGVHFDDSQMFDLVRWIRGQAAHADTPVVCVRSQSGFTAITSRTLEMTVRALDADDFFDLLDYPSEDAGNAALRKLATSFSGRTSAGTP